MDTNLNQYFLTFQIFNEGNMIHSIECPRSNIHEMTLKLKNLYPEYTIKVVDHSDRIRMDFSIFDRLNITIPY